GAGLAWIVFVLALVLLARSSRNESLAEAPPAHEAPGNEPQLGPANTAAVTELAAPYRAQLTESMPESRLSPLLEDLVPRLEPKEHLETHGAAPRGSFTSGGAVAPSAPDLLYKHRSVPVEQPTGAQGTSSSGTPRQNLGHVLALTGISLTNERLIPYGLFIIAEAVGSPRSGKASRRAVELIAEQIAPLLANDQALESEQLATLLQLAITRASLDLRKQCIRTATDLTVAVTGVMVLGGSV